MGKECRYCVDHAIGFVKTVWEALHDVHTRPADAQFKIKVAQDMLDELVKSECVTEDVAAPIADDLAEAYTETDLTKKANRLDSILRIYHYDLASNIADFCQRRG